MNPSFTDFSKDNNDKNPIKQKAACGFILVM